MTKLWIANTTKQHHDFVYRPKISDGGIKEGILRPMYGDIRKHTIPVGGQICVGDFSSEGEIRNILDQHKHIVDFKIASEVKAFNGLCYREGENPVPIEKILERINKNDEIRTEESKQRQADTALRIASDMRSVAQVDGAPFKDLRETDVQVAQQGNKEVNQGTPKLNQVVEVTEDGKAPSGRGRKSAA